jgi:hypothetical protein
MGRVLQRRLPELQQVSQEAAHGKNIHAASDKSRSNLRKVFLGTTLQMMQQWTGINFIFYYVSCLTMIPLRLSG